MGCATGTAESGRGRGRLAGAYAAPARGVELDNLQLLYAARSMRQLSVQDAALLVARFTRPRTIRCAVRAAGLPVLAGVDLVFHLIWKRQLHTDMALPLTPASTVWSTEA